MEGASGLRAALRRAVPCLSLLAKIVELSFLGGSRYESLGLILALIAAADVMGARRYYPPLVLHSLQLNRLRQPGAKEHRQCIRPILLGPFS